MPDRIARALVATLLVLAAARPVVGQEPGSASLAALSPAAPASDSPGTTEPALALWEALGDTTLTRLVREALAGNRDLRTVAARVDEARSIRTEAALDLAPTITASASYARQRLPLASVPGAAQQFPDRNYWDAGVTAAWELDIFGRLRGELRGQNALVSSFEADEEDAQVLVTAELARNYIELRGLQEQLTVARQNAKNQERTLALTRQRLDAGRGTAFDTERARAQLSLTRAAERALSAEIAATQHRIAVVVGRNPGAMVSELSTPASMPEFPEAPAIDSFDFLALRRPDVVSAERQLAAATAFHGAAKADYFPRVTLVGGAGWAANEFDDLGATGTSRFAVGPVVSWPLLDLGRVKAGADAAAARKEAAQAAYEQTRLRAAEEIRTALVQYRSARDRLHLLEEAAQASRRAADLARLRFEGGASDFLEVLDADRTRLAAEGQLAQGRTEVGTLFVELFRAFGGEWPEAAAR